MNLIANETGVLTGKFQIPQNIPAGSKSVIFTGQGGSRGETVFVGQGMLNISTYRNVTNVSHRRYDPLAQTFSIERAIQLAGVDLWFTAKETEVRVQIREVSNGVPTQVIVGEAIINPNNIVVTGNGHTRVLFPAPISLAANGEYALVVLCDDAITKLSIAVMGGYDKYVQQWVSAQPYSVGVLLSSSNASTWTPHQDRDLTFRLLESVFTGDKIIELGEVNIENSTDIILFALSDAPSASARIEYGMMLGEDTLTVSENQPVRLANPYTGTVKISAKLVGDDKASPVLFPGSQILAGEVQQTADYYTRSVVANNATKAVLIYDAILPFGASVIPSIQIGDGEWFALTANGTTQMGDNLVEYRFSYNLSAVERIKVKFVLTGTSQARPMVQNIRLMAVI